MAKVLVTGGGSGIGAATSAVLAAAGWEPVAADLRPPPGGLTLDVTDEAAWDGAMEAVGPIAGLVSCAGIRTRSLIVDLSLADWERTLRVDLTGTFLGVRAVMRRWLAAGTGGAIVNVASITSFRAVAGQADYVAAKAGVAMLTKAAALEGAPHGIRVNAVAPGPILTPMLQERLVEPEQQAWLEAQVPLHRIGGPEEVAESVEFLLSARAAYVTGVVLPVDGGWLAG